MVARQPSRLRRGRRRPDRLVGPLADPWRRHARGPSWPGRPYGPDAHADGFPGIRPIWYPDLSELPLLPLGELHSPSGVDAYAAANIWLADLLPLWEAYLHDGGFPATVATAKAAHPVPKWFIDTLFDVVHKDAFASRNLDETQTAQLVERIWASVSTPLNQSSVGADVGVHHDVVGRHLDSLRDAYLLWSVQQLDRSYVVVDLKLPT